MDRLLKYLRSYVSPVFLALLLASFVLWYIAKLSYTYTTGQVVRVDVGGEQFKVTCEVEGVGANLFAYRVYKDKTLRIPLSELKYKRSREEGHEQMLIINPQSLQSAISVRLSDIKVVSIGAVPEINTPEEKK